MRNIQTSLLYLLSNNQINWTNFFGMKDNNGDQIIETLKEDIRSKYKWNGQNFSTEAETKWLDQISYSALVGLYYNYQGHKKGSVMYNN
jgi:hypothetical protein